MSGVGRSGSIVRTLENGLDLSRVEASYGRKNGPNLGCVNASYGRKNGPDSGCVNASYGQEKCDSCDSV